MDPQFEDATDRPTRPSLEQLDRYLAGEATSAEAARVQSAMSSMATSGAMHSSKLEAHLRDGSSYALDPLEDEKAAGSARAWQALAERIAQSERETTSNARPKNHQHRSPRTPWRYVAGLACVALVGVFATSRLVERPSSPTRTTSTSKYTTAAGQRATIDLPNGSRAILGPATTLDVVSDPATGEATVAVVGEALFTVAHSARAPFSVRTGQSITRVLGTTFVVRKYSDDRVTQIFVSEGRVAVQATQENQSPGSQAVLAPNTLGVVNDSGQILLTQNIGGKKYTAWANGELIFEATPARDVVADLARAYGADIQIPDSSLAQQPITWGVETGRYPLAQALRELTTLLSAHVRMTDRTIILVPGVRASQQVIPSRSPLTTELRYGK